MSYSVDVNILIYATAKGCPEHARAKDFLRSCVESDTAWYLAWPTVMGYLRMVTHASILSQPLSPAAAAHNVESLLELPHVRMLAETDDFWDVYRRVTHGISVRGKLVPDAHLAALLRVHDVSTLYTNDKDFLKFEFLRVINPLKD